MQGLIRNRRPFILIVMCFALGCSSSTSNQTPEALNGRLEAASALTDTGKRDSALVKVAEDAASVGQAEVVKKALSKVSDTGKRDDAAENCALKLAKAGKVAEAADVAKTITDSGKRDSTLSKLAKA